MLFVGQRKQEVVSLGYEEKQECKHTVTLALGTKGCLAACSHMWRHSSIVVRVLNFRSEVQCFEAWSQPVCCFLGQETLLHIVSLHPGV